MFKKIKKLIAPSGVYNVKWDSSHGGGSFIMSKHYMEIGTSMGDQNSWDTIVHEVSELAHVELHQRYDRYDCHGDYLFSFNHAGHSTHSTMVASMLSQFIK